MTLKNLQPTICTPALGGTADALSRPWPCGSANGTGE